MWCRMISLKDEFDNVKPKACATDDNRFQKDAQLTRSIRIARGT